MSVERGRGPDAIPAIVKVNHGKIELLELERIGHTHVCIPNEPDQSARLEFEPQRVYTITDVKYYNGEIFVTGIFESAIRVDALSHSLPVQLVRRDMHRRDLASDAPGVRNARANYPATNPRDGGEALFVRRVWLHTARPLRLEHIEGRRSCARRHDRRTWLWIQSAGYDDLYRPVRSQGLSACHDRRAQCFAHRGRGTGIGTTGADRRVDRFRTGRPGTHTARSADTGGAFCDSGIRDGRSPSGGTRKHRIASTSGR